MGQMPFLMLASKHTLDFLHSLWLLKHEEGTFLFLCVGSLMPLPNLSSTTGEKNSDLKNPALWTIVMAGGNVYFSLPSIALCRPIFDQLPPGFDVQCAQTTVISIRRSSGVEPEFQTEWKMAVSYWDAVHPPYFRSSWGISLSVLTAIFQMNLG